MSIIINFAIETPIAQAATRVKRFMVKREIAELERQLEELERSDTVEFIKEASRQMTRIAIAHKRAEVARWNRLINV
jgi:hypothetical protein